MTYDKDLKWNRRAAFAFAFANLAAAILAIDNWSIVIGCLIWCFSSLAWVSHIRSFQVTRNEAKAANYAWKDQFNAPPR